jgi:hypothetical protein
MFEADLGSVFRLYRAALARCWLPSLLLALAWGWMATLLDRRLESSDDVFAWVAQVQALSWSGYFWWLSCAVGAISVFFYSAMVADIYAVATGGATPLAAGLYAALRALPGAMVASLIFLAATTVGTLFFVLPGVYLWGMWQLWLVVLVVEHSGPLRALSRSWQLMQGCWWRISALITVVSIVSFLPIMVFDVLVGAMLLTTGRDAAHAPPLITALGIALLVLLLPMIPAALVAAYLDRQRAPVVHG